MVGEFAPGAQFARSLTKLILKRSFTARQTLCGAGIFHKCSRLAGQTCRFANSIVESALGAIGAIDLPNIVLECPAATFAAFEGSIGVGIRANIAELTIGKGFDRSVETRWA